MNREYDKRKSVKKNEFRFFWTDDHTNYQQESSGDYNWLSYTKKWGYNDLLRRKNDLCSFLVSSCSLNPTAIQMIHSLTKIPLPLAGH